MTAILNLETDFQGILSGNEQDLYLSDARNALHFTTITISTS